MKKILKKATIWLQSPSRGSLWYLIILFLLASSSSVYYWLRDGNLVSALNLAARGLIVCYAIVLFCDLFKGKARKALYIFFVVLVDFLI